MLQWHHATIVPWYQGAVVPGYDCMIDHDTLVPWCHDTMAAHVLSHPWGC